MTTEQILRDLRDENKRLREDLINAEIEAEMMRKLFVEKYNFIEDDLPKKLKHQRLFHMLRAPFYDKNEMVMYKISQITGVTMEQIKGKSRITRIVTARFACFWALYEMNNLSFSDIARLFGVHHTSIMHGISTFKGRSEMKQNYEYHLVKDIICQ